MPISSIKISFKASFKCTRHSSSDKLVVDIFSFPSSTTKSSNTIYSVRYIIQRSVNHLLQVPPHYSPSDRFFVIRNGNLFKHVSSSGIHSFTPSSTQFCTWSFSLVNFVAPSSIIQKLLPNAFLVLESTLLHLCQIHFARFLLYSRWVQSQRIRVVTWVKAGVGGGRVG